MRDSLDLDNLFEEDKELEKEGRVNSKEIDDLLYAPTFQGNTRFSILDNIGKAIPLKTENKQEDWEEGFGSPGEFISI